MSRLPCGLGCEAVGRGEQAPDAPENEDGGWSLQDTMSEEQERRSVLGCQGL